MLNGKGAGLKFRKPALYGISTNLEQVLRSF